jgi:hypothetical protein
MELVCTHPVEVLRSRPVHPRQEPTHERNP